MLMSFFGGFNLHRDNPLQKRHKPRCLAFVRKVEIHSILESLDAQTAPVRAVLQYQLFQIQKCPLVTHALSDLHQGLPRPLSEGRLAFDALLIPHNELHNEGLLQYRASGFDLPLNREPNFEPHGVRFRPHPGRVDQPHLALVILAFIETIDIRQA